MSYKTYEVRVYYDGSREWRLNGQRHREDGPAYEGAGNACREWWLNGNQLSEAEWKKATNPVKELTVKELEKLLGHPVKIVK